MDKTDVDAGQNHRGIDYIYGPNHSFCVNMQGRMEEMWVGQSFGVNGHRLWSEIG